MSLLRKKRLWQQVLVSPLAIIILLGICIAFSFAVHDRYSVEREMASRREKSEVELKRENEKLEKLQKEVDRLNNKQGIEAEIRKNFDVAREGETVVILVEEEKPDIEPIPPPPKQSLWKRFLHILFPW